MLPFRIINPQVREIRLLFYDLNHNLPSKKYLASGMATNVIQGTNEDFFSTFLGNSRTTTATPELETEIKNETETSMINWNSWGENNNNNTVSQMVRSRLSLNFLFLFFVK